MPWWIYATFLAFIATLIFLDLCVLHRRDKAMTIRAALGWTSLWIAVGLSFNVVVYWLYENPALSPPPVGDAEKLTGTAAALQFFTGYLIEYSLSIDNLFVIAMIMANFHVPAENQHRLLFWGILGAAILRGIMILAGAALVQQFEWTMYLFGLLLIFSGAKLLVTRHDNINPDGNMLVRATRRIMPVTRGFYGSRFFVKEHGKLSATPMFLALLLIESCDVMFAVDSIPAVFAVTQDPFLIFTSNIFAILGLRSLYFALAGLMDKFRYLSTSLVFLLVFVGTKMLLHDVFHIPELASLAMIGSILTVGVVASVVAGDKDTAALHAAPVPGEEDEFHSTLEDPNSSPHSR